MLAPYPRARGATIGGSHVLSRSERLLWLTWSREENGLPIVKSVDQLDVPEGNLVLLRSGLGVTDAVPSILVTWWGVLLALSSLARYEPVAWRRALDIDKARTADPLERAINGEDACSATRPGFCIPVRRRSRNGTRFSTACGTREQSCTQASRPKCFKVAWTSPSIASPGGPAWGQTRLRGPPSTSRANATHPGGRTSLGGNNE